MFTVNATVNIHEKLHLLKKINEDMLLLCINKLFQIFCKKLQHILIIFAVVITSIEEHYYPVITINCNCSVIIMLLK